MRLGTAKEARRPGQSSSAAGAAADGEAAGDSGANDNDNGEEAQQPQQPEKRYEASSHMEADLVDVLGEWYNRTPLSNFSYNI